MDSFERFNEHVERRKSYVDSNVSDAQELSQQKSFEFQQQQEQINATLQLARTIAKQAIVEDIKPHLALNIEVPTNKLLDRILGITKRPSPYTEAWSLCMPTARFDCSVRAEASTPGTLGLCLTPQGQIFSYTTRDIRKRGVIEKRQHTIVCDLNNPSDYYRHNNITGFNVYSNREPYTTLSAVNHYLVKFVAENINIWPPTNN